MTIENWSEIKTGKQKDRLIKAVLHEINLLRKSHALKDLLIDDGVTLGEIEFHNGNTYAEGSDAYSSHTLEMLKNGSISIYDPDGIGYGCRSYIKKSELPRIIAEYELLPKGIRDIRKKIER